MDKPMQAALMADFADEQMGHKPATWCKACTEATKQNRYPSACGNGEHVVRRCPKCQTKITTAHVCLTFVGHADVRARLCEVDPEWTWEPFEFPGTGSLVIIDGHPVGMWIHLTVGGVTRPGYGSVDKGKPEAIKELIGDALRNAGLSFGIAWKLWAKGERSGGERDEGEPQQASGNPRSAGDAWENAAPAKPDQPSGEKWLEDAITKASTSTDLDALRDLFRDAKAQQDAGVITPQNAKHVQGLVNARFEELKTRQPAEGGTSAPGGDPWAMKLEEIATREDAQRIRAEVERAHKGAVLDSRRAKALMVAIARKEATLPKAGEAA